MRRFRYVVPATRCNTLQPLHHSAIYCTKLPLEKKLLQKKMQLFTYVCTSACVCVRVACASVYMMQLVSLSVLKTFSVCMTYMYTPCWPVFNSDPNTQIFTHAHTHTHAYLPWLEDEWPAGAPCTVGKRGVCNAYYLVGVKHTILWV